LKYLNTALIRLLTKVNLIALVCGIGSAFAADPSYVLYSYDQDHFLAYKNIEQVRPIASITKLMTAIVTIENGVDLNERVAAKQSRLHSSVSRLDLLYSMLIASDNGAAESLAESYPGGRDAFISAMNATANKYHLSSTSYVDPSGLGEGNQSNVVDLIQILKIAGQKQLIRNISVNTEHKFSIPFRKKQQYITIHNTNRTSLFAYDNIVLTKTGFTNPAGRCVAMLVEKDQGLYAVVILGEPDIKHRWRLIQNLMDYFKTNEINLYTIDKTNNR
jgi:serine-type D-Ala-D-Ala endopeptidase (penicillin-binding protein 7)